MIEKLNSVLSKHFVQEIVNAEYTVKPLSGGDVGDVRLYTGTAQTAHGEKLDFKLVFKKQNKWKRYGDSVSWRREYDLYLSNLQDLFSDLRWPKCYHAEINGEETQIWMEYIKGISGNDLTIEMLEQMAEDIGRFQGRLSAQNNLILDIANLTKPEFMKIDYKQWNPQTKEYCFIRSADCPIPAHLCQMLIEMDNEEEKIFERISKLPFVLCHRDLWIENLFYADGKTILIDWDTAGWGYLGEDIASLIADDTDVSLLDEYYQRLIPAYYKGLSEQMDVSWIDDNCIWEMILIKFGYRFIHRYIFGNTAEIKNQQISALQKIHDMKK